MKIDLPVKITWIFFAVLLTLKLTEYLYFLHEGGVFRSQEFIIGILNDLLVVSFTGIFFIILFIGIPKRFHRHLSVINISIIGILTLIAVGLNEYFFETLIPADESILIYSLSDLVYIISTSTDFNTGILLRAGVLIFVMNLLFVLLRNKTGKLNVRFLLFSVVLMSTVTALHYLIIPDLRDFTNNQTYYQRVNKTQYLLSRVWENYHTTLAFSKTEIIQKSKQFQLQNRHFSYLTPQYPFQRKQSNKDVLGDYFQLSEEKPNLVFVIVESLSRKFSGPDSEWVSFTPSLDSLAKHSLYWKNFVSTSERTFNVLPSTFASLPYGEKGFMAIAEDTVYPHFISLPEILKREGYQNNFFYGGWANFDKMNVFLDSLHFDVILNDKKFGDNYQKIQESERGLTWGYPDHAVFRKAMEILDTITRQPQLDVYMTLSMHSPFFPPNEQKWRNEVHRRLESLGVEENDKDFYLKRELIFATILYTDDAIGQLIEDYSQRPGFDNTIFLIMGDHHLATGNYSPVEKYHVPLMIYSPMIQQPEIFPAVSSTADITPTLISLLDENFNFDTPGWVHWLGQQLDTSSVFRSKNFVPFMRVNRNIDEMLYHELFYSEGRLFQLENDLELKRISDPEKIDLMEERMNTFNALNDYVCFENMIYK